VLLCAPEMWTLLASDMKAIESFHMKYQCSIFGIKWHDFVQNFEVLLHTGPSPVCHWITSGWSVIVEHVARLPDNTVHARPEAMPHQVELSAGKLSNPTWRHPPGGPCVKWTDQHCVDNKNVPITTMCRQAVGHGLVVT